VLLKYRRTRLIWAGLLLLAGFAIWLNLDSLLIRFGGTFGIPVSQRTFWLPRAIKLGLSEPAPEAIAAPLVWTKADEGFDIAWLDVMSGGSMADGIALARIDPSRHRFAILQEPNGKKHLENWMRDTGAELIVNASYYDRAGKPATPVVDQGAVSGPPDYQSQHGAFVVKGSQGDIRDLKIEKWQDLFEHAEAGLVSYPLLLAPGGTKRTVASQWLANRSFIGVDHQGRVLIGTTQSAFFSLDRLASFLKAAMPDLKAALNLDGGPVASQAIAVGDVRRKLHGRWELQAENGAGRLLPVSIFTTAPMPVVIAVFKREGVRPPL
jgi:Phosphodiester glycosidase